MYIYIERESEREGGGDAVPPEKSSCPQYIYMYIHIYICVYVYIYIERGGEKFYIY